MKKLLLYSILFIFVPLYSGWEKPFIEASAAIEKNDVEILKENYDLLCAMEDYQKTYLLQGSLLKLDENHKQFEIAALLVQAGADLNWVRHAPPLLIQFVRGESYSAVKFLLDWGANPTIKDRSGNDALYYLQRRIHVSDEFKKIKGLFKERVGKKTD